MFKQLPTTEIHQIIVMHEVNNNTCRYLRNSTTYSNRVYTDTPSTHTYTVIIFKHMNICTVYSMWALKAYI